MNALQQSIEELLPRYCEGLTDAEETKVIEEWITKSEENKQIVKQLLSINLAVDAKGLLDIRDTEQALQKVKDRIRSRKYNWKIWTQRVAAILFLPLLIGYLLLWNDKYRETPQMVEVKTNPGITTSVILPDSTVVYLNSESSLRYPSKFSGKIRNVEIRGEAYFEVAKNPKKQFVVSTYNGSQIKVYGTKFNLESYETDDYISTTLLEGSIGFSFKAKDGAYKQIRIHPHQKLVYQPQEEKTNLYLTKGDVETAWKDGKIIFDNTPMADVLRMLSKRFNVEFIISANRLNNYSFTGMLTTQRLDMVLKYLKRSSKIQWKYLDSGDLTEKKQRIEIY
ncbi:FecR domain-containing protein [uncultured Bacteroides sp.]|uniref:FecR family protein n=1 Tax=uncultured Bacteroides sp. TaxID=162156 RepID=UPI002AA896D5|nr:FecR domain-containing protein [uncultured Bacteroides sp.]